jgi:hypothetical protein
MLAKVPRAPIGSDRAVGIAAANRFRCLPVSPTQTVHASYRRPLGPSVRFRPASTLKIGIRSAFLPSSNGRNGGRLRIGLFGKWNGNVRSVRPAFLSANLLVSEARNLNIAKILAQLKAERRKLDAAIRALQGLALTTWPSAGSLRSRHYPRKNKAGKVRSSGSAAGVQPVGQLLMFTARRRSRVASPTGAKKKLSGESTGA